MIIDHLPCSEESAFALPWLAPVSVVVNNLSQCFCTVGYSDYFYPNTALMVA
jgi:hypothetical protein